MSRAVNEVAHGRFLADSDPEAVWGWKTPAGQIRAARRSRLIAEGAGLGPGVRALEIGCGTGNFTEAFARTGATLVAIDISPELLTRAHSRGFDVNQVRLVCGRFEDLPADDRFDAVIGSSVLHHLELEPALRTMRRLLKPGGVLSFAEPNMRNPQVYLERHLRFLFSYVSPDETAFVRGSLAALLTREGFEDISITPFDWLHPATPPALIPAVQRCGSLFEQLPGVRECAGSLLIRARTRS
jgi:SAM-dependent methyltransferase